MSGEKQHELYARRRGRNWTVFGGLFGLAALIFAVTILKMQEHIASPFAEQFNPRLELMQEQAQ